MYFLQGYLAPYSFNCSYCLMRCPHYQFLGRMYNIAYPIHQDAEIEPTFVFNRIQQYPPVDSKLFMDSAKENKSLLTEASTLLSQISNSKELATHIMEAAQASNSKEVDRLIQSTGMKANFKTSYTPSGLRVNLWPELNEKECCKLELSIRWSN